MLIDRAAAIVEEYAPGLAGQIQEARSELARRSSHILGSWKQLEPTAQRIPQVPDTGLRLPRLRPDLAPLRESRDFRLVVVGSFLSGLGAQATLVALPYQVYIQTRSALLVGLLGAVELAPLIAAALLGGAIADRVDRRKLLLLDQVGLVLTAAALAAAAAIGDPAIGVLYALAALLAAFVSLENVVVSAIVPNLVDRRRLCGALALEYGLGTLTMVVGPALGGLVISALGLT
jgi:MFS family permease